jgi:hypothetical protein
MAIGKNGGDGFGSSDRGKGFNFQLDIISQLGRKYAGGGKRMDEPRRFAINDAAGRFAKFTHL